MQPPPAAELCQGLKMAQQLDRKRWVPSDHAKNLLETIFTADSFPTCGVCEIQNAAAWLDAGAYACGFVASLFPRELVEAEGWDEIESRARAILSTTRAVD